LEQTGFGFIPPDEHPAFDTHRAKAREGLKRAALALAKEQYDLVVLDEVCVAVARGLIEESSVLAAIDEAHLRASVVLTGRQASPGLIAIADTVTEMRAIRHAFEQGRVAEQGVEW
jgi:cob(I)alamin adenosyltransferase